MKDETKPTKKNEYTLYTVRALCGVPQVENKRVTATILRSFVLFVSGRSTEIELTDTR